MDSWSCTLEVTTPMALAGANQQRAELRPNTFKNMMRWWWRAGRGRLDRDREARLFGDLGRENTEGERVKGSACPFRLRLYPCNPKAKRSLLFDQFLRSEGLLSKKNNIRLKGLGYLGHYLDPSDDPGNPARGVLRPGAQFRAKFVFPDWFGEGRRRELWASLWLLVWFGGMGARTRRGFGGLKVINSEPTGDLKLAFPDSSPEALRSFLEENLQQARRWLGAPVSAKQTMPEYTALVPDWTRIFVHKVLVNGSQDKRDYGRNTPGWAKALHAAGKDMREHRNELRTAYGEVFNFLKEEGYAPDTVDRAAFGLPLTFWYPPIEDSTGSRDLAEAKVGQHQRRASPLFIRAHRTEDDFGMFALVYILMKARLLPEENGEEEKIEMTCEARNRKEHVDQPDFSRVDEFFDKDESELNFYEDPGPKDHFLSVSLQSLPPE